MHALAAVTEGNKDVIGVRIGHGSWRLVRSPTAPLVRRRTRVVRYRWRARGVASAEAPAQDCHASNKGCVSPDRACQGVSLRRQLFRTHACSRAVAREKHERNRRRVIHMYARTQNTRTQHTDTTCNTLVEHGAWLALHERTSAPVVRHFVERIRHAHTHFASAWAASALDVCPGFVGCEHGERRQTVRRVSSTGAGRGGAFGGQRVLTRRDHDE